MGLRAGMLAALTIFQVMEGAAQCSSDVLAKKYDTYQSVWAKTNLHLILNQNKYSPGDTIWLKAYLLTEEGGLVPGRQLVDINLVDQLGNSKGHITFAVSDGIGYNQLPISGSLAAGAYYLIAHTKWMLNFGPSLFFRQKIEVVREKALAATTQGSAVIAAEGGHLVAGISNNVSISTQRPHTAVYVVDNDGEVVTRAVTDGHGTCKLVLHPATDNTYFLTIENDKTRTPLPPAEPDGLGIALLFRPEQNETLGLRVTAPENSRLAQKNLTLLLTSNGESRHSACFTVEGNDPLVLEINQGILTPGVNTISMFDDAGQAIAYRNFFFAGKSSTLAKVVSQQSQYSPRDKVRLEVYLTDDAGIPAEGEFSVSVVNKGLFNKHGQSLLPGEFPVSPFLREWIEIVGKEPDDLSSLDNHMITMPLNIPWTEILANVIPAPPFKVSNRLRLSGKAFYANTSQAVSGGTRLMFYLQKNQALYQTMASKSGEFALEILDIMGDDEVFNVAEAGKKNPQTVKIEWSEDSVQLPPSPIFTETEVDDAYGAFAERNLMINQSYAQFFPAGSPSKSEIKDQNIGFEMMAGGANYTCNIADYIPFPSMEELIDEIVRPLTIRTKRKATVVRMKSMQSQVGISDPLYMIDGTVTQNTAFFLSLKPSDLLSIKVIDDPRKLSKLGLMGKNGVVIVTSKLGGLREPATGTVKVLHGLSEGLSYPATDYSGERYRNAPNFRSTVYWNPSVRTDRQGKATIEFFCSDDIGELGIYVDGMDVQGKPFNTDYFLEVIPHK